MQDSDLYTIAEIGYKKMCNEKYSDLKDEDIYPLNWFLIDDTHKKIEIIAEAIENKILIKDTSLFKNYNIKRCRITELNPNK